jgi:hypothetical protein
VYESDAVRLQRRTARAFLGLMLVLVLVLVRVGVEIAVLDLPVAMRVCVEVTAPPPQKQPHGEEHDHQSHEHLGAAGVNVRLRLSHEVLGHLVGAQRASVTTALRHIGESGRLARRTDGTWLLRGATGRPRPSAMGPPQPRLGACRLPGSSGTQYV